MFSLDGTLDLTRLAATRRLQLRAPGQLAPAVIATWRGRMINEYMSSYVFAGLAEQLRAAGDLAAAARCEEFAAEEREHGALCGAVVEAAGGAARAVVAPPRAVPEHRQTTRRVAAARNLLSVSCLSETVAVALIGAERLEMPEGALRDVLTRIWADEIGHARFGWAWLDAALPQLSDDERRALERYLPTALAHLEHHELAHLPADSQPPAEGKVYGLCSGRDARVLFYDTVTEVIVPELERRGLRAEAAWRGRKAA